MEDEEPGSMYKNVVLGGDVWDLLDELMIYMRNPMRYFEKKVKFVRVIYSTCYLFRTCLKFKLFPCLDLTVCCTCIQGVLLSGPPGTGKTLFARTLSKESGMPFIFASGAEFSDSEKSGAARINELFSMARRNVSFSLSHTYFIEPRVDSNLPTSNTPSDITDILCGSLQMKL